MVVRIVVVALMAAAGWAFVGCGGKMSKDAARQELEQLMALYKDNKPKFVEQKQQLIQASSCDRATALREAAAEKAQQAAMSPESTEAITMVKMELDQAEKDCLAK